MTVIKSNTGIERDIDLDIDRILEFEDRDPDWSIVKITESLNTLRMHDLDQLAYALGFDGIKDYFAQGFTVRQINDIIKGSKILGFQRPSAGPEPTDA